MALIWADSFDHYGNVSNGGRDGMLSGAWASFSGNSGSLPRIVDTVSRTGTYSLSFPSNGQIADKSRARRSLGGVKTNFGIGFGIYFVGLPVNGNRVGYQFQDIENNVLLSFMFNTNGSISVKDGGFDGTTIGVTEPVLVSSAFDHIETHIVFDDVVGEVEIRVNGNPVLLLEDQNLGTDGAALFSIGELSTATSTVSDNAFMIDDIFAWDSSGANNNTFLGPQRVTTIFADADTAQADWAVTGAGSGYEAIDEVPPDGDTSYVSTDTVSDVSEFQLSDLPAEVVTISGVYIPAMAKLTEAGTGGLQVSLVSGVEVSAGPEHSLTTVYTYYGSIHEQDPETDVAWTKSGLEAALLRIEKTS